MKSATEKFVELILNDARRKMDAAETGETVCISSSDNKARFLLGEIGEDPIIVFGINPSTADDKEDDQTIKKVKRIVKASHHDGWIMLNLYPQRSKDFTKVHRHACRDYVDANEAVIDFVLNRYPKSPLLAAWGYHIDDKDRAYLKDCRRSILSLAGDRPWLCVGGVTVKGHPRHPLFVRPDDIGILHFNDDGTATRLEFS